MLTFIWWKGGSRGKHNTHSRRARHSESVVAIVVGNTQQFMGYLASTTKVFADMAELRLKTI